MNKAWVLLLFAITSEVIGTSCLKLSEGFSKPIPTLVVLVAYSTSMLLLSRVVQTIPLGITYALWSGIGIVAIVLVGLFAYKQVPSPGQLVGNRHNHSWGDHRESHWPSGSLANKEKTTQFVPEDHKGMVCMAIHDQEAEIQNQT